MDFIANATGSIFAQGWTPELQKMVGGQGRTPPASSRPSRPSTRRNSNRVSHAADEASSRAGDREIAEHPDARRRLATAGPLETGDPPRRPWSGWLFVLPALAMYAVFVLQPLALTVQYSFYRWDGVGPATWVGLSNYVDRAERAASSFETMFNAFRLVLFFSLIPVSLGLVTASVIQRVATGRLGTISRTVLFLPQVIPLVAAGIIWGWLLSLSGLDQPGVSPPSAWETSPARGSVTSTRRFRPSGIIGIWVLLGFCTVLLLTGMTKIEPALYESARLDGAGWFQEFRAITVPSLRIRDRRVPHRHRHRRARRVRHRLRVDRRWPWRRDRGARASRSTSSPSSSDKSASRPPSPSSCGAGPARHPADPAPEPGERVMRVGSDRALCRSGLALRLMVRSRSCPS